MGLLNLLDPGISKLIHFLLLRSHFDGRTLVHFLLLCFLGYLGLWLGHVPTLNQVVELFVELLETARQQVYILIALLSHQIGSGRSLPLISHVYDNQFVSFVLESIQLGYDFVPANVRRRVVDCFLDAPEVVLLGLSQIEQEETG